MTQPLNELYREVILEHNRNPRNFGELPPPCEHVHAHNAFCGDKLDFTFRIVGPRLDKVMFTGVGCALSQASASMLTEQLSGLPLLQALQIVEEFQQAFKTAEPVQLPEQLQVLLNAKQFPSRTDCVLMGWRALQADLREATS